MRHHLRHIRCACTFAGLLAASILLFALASGILQSPVPPLTDLQEKSLQARDQDPGSGERSKDAPPGVKAIRKAPFAGNDSLPWSPPSCPTPELRAEGTWTDSIRRAEEYLADWSVKEQVDLVTGSGWQSGLCVGNIAPNKKRGFKGLCLQDSPTGVRLADLVNVFPAGITLAATFDSKLAYRRGKAMGKEFRAKGVNIALGPGMSHLRSAAGGRNWEMGGADPYLNGESAFNTIRGLQSQGVQACAKHLLGNEQEHFRTTSSSNIDERAMREIYLHPFLRAVQADVAAMMCSYNLLNNTYACENSYLMNDILKREMAFKGYVMSDWGARHSTVESATGGLDMSMPGDLNCCEKFKGDGTAPSFWRGNLTRAVDKGTVDAARLKDMGVRIFAPYFHLGQDRDDYPSTNFDTFDPTSAANQHVNVNKLFYHAPLIREIAAAGIVLLKNTNKSGKKEKALPLKKQSSAQTPNHIALIGSAAGPAYKGANFFGDRGGTDGVEGVGWGSGSTDFSILISPYEALQKRAAQDGTALSWSSDDYDYKHIKEIADERIVDTALVFLQSDSGEEYITVDGNGGDRQNSTAWHNGNKLVKEVASVNSNTIVVIQNPAQVDVGAFIHNKNISAVLFARMGGREAGNAIVDILYGDYVPSGRLPYTLAKDRSDYPAEITYLNQSTTQYIQINYTEGILTDYRHFDHHQIEPRFEFGFGLSHSKFEYGVARGRWIDSSNWEDLYYPSHTRGLPKELFKDVYEFSFSLTNTGSYDGHEVPQAYLHLKGERVKALRRFDRVWLKKGETKRITWKLSRYDLSRWDVVRGSWVKPEGELEVLIGQSSRMIKRKFTL